MRKNAEFVEVTCSDNDEGTKMASLSQGNEEKEGIH